MENLVQPKTKMVNTPVQESKYFVAENNIIPLKVATPQLILELEETKNVQILEENEVQTIVKENKGKHILDKFFVKVSDYVDSVEKFLKNLRKLLLKSIEQKKLIYETEKMDQFFKTKESKKLIKNKRESEKKSKNKGIDLATDKDNAMMIAGALGMGVSSALSSMLPGGTQVYSDVVKEGEFGVQQGQNVSAPPAWIPFPKGTSGLVYTSGYGMRLSPTSGQYRMHSGIDIAGPVGSPIITPISGMVSSAGDDGDGYGYKVVITSGQLKMLFGHMDRQPPVSVGQQLQAGTVIGGLGNSGQSTGPHLHWNVYVNGSTVNPVDWTKANPPQVGTAGARNNPNTRPLDQESEGGININRRIMVGEAGVEFTIPISQMPLFIKAMMEEKVKTLIPNYEGTTEANVGFKTSSGPAQTKFASGAIVKYAGNPNYRLAAKKLKSLFPEAKDYHIAAAMGNFETESTGMYPNRYQGDYSTPPTWKKPGSGPGRGIAQWEIDHAGNNFNGRWSQGIKKFGPSLFTSLPKQLDFVKWELDNNTRYLPWGNATKTEWLGSKDLISATKNFLEGYEAPSIPHMNARILRAQSFLANMRKKENLLGIPEQPKPKPKEENIFDKIKNFFLPPKNKVAFSPTPITTPSLTDIPDNVQQEIAYDTQSKFEMFAEPENSILIMKVPVIIDKTTTGIKVVG